MIEVLLAIALFAIFATTLVISIGYGEQSSASAGLRTRAAILADEGVEVARNIRNTSYDNLVDGTYGLAFSAGKWALTGSPTAVDSFTRQITISTISDSVKKVTSQVSWPQTPSGTAKVTFDTYLTNWILNQPSDWIDPLPEPNPLPDNVAGLKIQTQGNYAYVIRGSQTKNFIIVDITNPDVPQIAATLDLSGTPTNIALSGNFAFVSNADSSQNMQVIDITTPATPVFNPAWSFKGLGNAPATSIMIQGNRAYLTREYKMISNSPTFYTIDIANPKAPVSLGYVRLKEPAFGLPVSAFDIYVSGNYAYTSSGFLQTGFGLIPYLQTIDISQDQPVLKKSVTPFNLQNNFVLGSAITITGFGNIVAIGQEGPANKLYLYDVATPLTPVLKSAYNIGGRPNDISYGPSSKYIYVASDAANQQFQLIDVTDPSNPTLYSKLNLNDTLNGICYSSSKDRVYALGNQANSQFIIIRPQ